MRRITRGQRCAGTCRSVRDTLVFLVAGVLFALPIASSFGCASISVRNCLSCYSHSNKPGHLLLFATSDDSESNEISNISWLQQRFDLSDDWALRTSRNTRGSMDSANRTLFEERIHFLQGRLDFTEEDVATMIRRWPMWLQLRVENVGQTLDFLHELLGADIATLSKVVRKFPVILNRRIDMLESNYSWLQSRLKIEDQKMQRIVTKFPQILSLSQDNNLEPKIQWFEQNFTPLGARTLLQKYLPLIWCSIEQNLEPKLAFYQDCVGEETAKMLLLNCPAMMTYSLDKRLKPRLQEAKEERILVDANMMRNIAQYTNAQWERCKANQQKNR